MRTRLTIDDDVFNLIEMEMRRSGTSLKETVNRYLRAALAASKIQDREPFIVEPLNLGLPPEMNYDKVSELLECLDGLNYR